jgi:hypothetical protein
LSDHCIRPAFRGRRRLDGRSPGAAKLPGAEAGGRLRAARAPPRVVGAGRTFGRG